MKPRNILCYTLLLLTSVLATTRANAGCYFSNGGQKATLIAKLPATIQIKNPEPPSGTILYDSGQINNPENIYLECDTTGVAGVSYKNQGTPTSLDHVFATSVPGIGIKVYMALNNEGSPIASNNIVPWTDTSVQAHYYIPSAFDYRIQFIATGEPIKSGTFSPANPYVYGYYENLTTHELIFTAVNFTVPTAGCTVNDSSLSIPLGTYSTTDFTGINTTTANVDVPISLQCPAGVKVQATLNATKDTATPQPGAIKVEPSSGLTASGVALQVVDSENNGVPIGEATTFNQTTEGNLSFGWKVHYLQTTSSPVTAGDANASATVTINYE